MAGKGDRYRPVDRDKWSAGYDRAFGKKTDAEPSLPDVVMAHRYLYYVEMRPIISDRDYDRLEREALEQIGPDHPLRKPGSEMSSSYTEEQKALARRLRREA